MLCSWSVSCRRGKLQQEQFSAAVVPLCLAGASATGRQGCRCGRRRDLGGVGPEDAGDAPRLCPERPRSWTFCSRRNWVGAISKVCVCVCSCRCVPACVGACMLRAYPCVCACASFSLHVFAGACLSVRVCVFLYMCVRMCVQSLERQRPRSWPCPLGPRPCLAQRRGSEVPLLGCVCVCLSVGQWTVPLGRHWLSVRLFRGAEDGTG